MNKHTLIFAGAIVIALAILGFSYFSKPPTPLPTTTNLDNFAQCLADKKITMYGASWCPHCLNEKNRFGDSFRLVPYVECPDNIKMCLDLGINGYPTWILPDGKKLEGEQGIEKLSQESGCPLPKSEIAPL